MRSTLLSHERSLLAFTGLPVAFKHKQPAAMTTPLSEVTVVLLIAKCHGNTGISKVQPSGVIASYKSRTQRTGVANVLVFSSAGFMPVLIRNS
jgi:hypothetical protein